MAVLSGDTGKIVNAIAADLSRVWGLDPQFSIDVAIFLLYLWQYGVTFTITSGFRSPEKQKELLRRYNAGDPSVVVKPATTSKHSVTTGLFGTPAALAIDISTSNPTFAAQIAEAVGIGTGIRFTPPDPVHFYSQKRG
jgi:hypothetical protein